MGLFIRCAIGALASAVWLFVVPAYAVTIDWITVGDPGNAADTTGYGGVPYPYIISRYEITNSQYVEFLNSVDTFDTYELYDSAMSLSPLGGITRIGGLPRDTFEVKAGMGDKPVNNVTFYDALRFVNWLNNGQGSGDTETGAYTLLGGTPTPSNGATVTRNSGGPMIFLTSENEWYKAAFYDALSTSYFDYPAGSDTNPICAAPGATPNTANCNGVLGELTDVGAYTGSASPYGTFDQAGNVMEWTDSIMSPPYRFRRGGSYGQMDFSNAASTVDALDPESSFNGLGFRLVTIPEPSTTLLLAFGLAGLALMRRGRPTV
jgi:formylglycine-generating enzyme required for sulfatase activity